jgi:hypothetical protein
MDEQQVGCMVRQAMLESDSGANPKNVAPVLMSQGLKKNRPCSPKNAKRT